MYGLFSSLESGGYSRVVVRGLLIAVASLVAEYRPQGMGVSAVVVPRLKGTDSIVVVHGGSSWTRIESVSPALAGRFSLPEPPKTLHSLSQYLVMESY